MKKFALSILAVVLMLTLLCGTALAWTGDLTLKATKAYADPGLSIYIGTIPKYTSVLVRGSGSSADIYYNGTECYVKASSLTQGKHDYDYVGYAVLKPGAVVYQRPTSHSRSVTNGKARTVMVYAMNSGYAMIRTGSKGIFGFVDASNLYNLKAF